MPDGKIILQGYTPSPKQQKKKDIIIAVFFDGTSNNRTNVAIRRAKAKKDAGKTLDSREEELAAMHPNWTHWDMDSYNDNDESNVARMETCYVKSETDTDTYCFYIEGPGTEDGESDTVNGYARGMGETGVMAKVKKAIDLIIEEIKEGIEYNLKLDAYGFSRGAAGARYFVHRMVTSPTYVPKAWLVATGTNTATINDQLTGTGYLGQQLAKAGKIVNYISVRFVGLYDTVSSYGLNYKDDVGELKLDSIGNSRVQKVVQLAAADEVRKNFSLTTIASAGSKGLQLYLPGVHSDIGGSYMNGVETRCFYASTVSEEDYIKDMVDKGWYGEYNKATDSGLKIFYVNTREGKIPYNIVGKRYLDQRYSYIPMHILCSLAAEVGSNFNTAKLNRYFGIPQADNHILRYVYSKLQEYVEVAKKDEEQRKPDSYLKYLDMPNLKVLRKGYLHISYKMRHAIHSPKANMIRDEIRG